MLVSLVTFLVLASSAAQVEQPASAQDRAPLTFRDAQAQYLQNGAALLPLRVRWQLRVRYGEARRQADGAGLAGRTETEFREFWTDGASWRALTPWGTPLRRLPTEWLTGSPREVAMRARGYHVVLYDAERDILVTVSEGETEDVTAASILRELGQSEYLVPPLTPVRPQARAVLRSSLHLMDQVMLGKWRETRHICPGCKADDPTHYFELLKDETPHAAYLTPEERKLYSTRVQRFSGWLVQVDVAHGAIPLGIWSWDRTYFDGEEVTPVGPLDRIEHDTPIMEVERVEQVSSAAYYPMRVVVRKFVPAPGSLTPWPSFEERVLRRGRRFAFPRALDVQREWTVLALDAGVATPRIIFDSTAVGRVVYDATRLEFPESNDAAVVVPPEGTPAPSASSGAGWTPFVVGFVLAFIAAALLLGLRRKRRWS